MIPYTLIRKKRKTVSITVANGELRVCAPMRLSREAIDAFVQSKEKWIAKKLAIQQTRKETYSEFLTYQKYAYLGDALTPKYVSGSRIYIENESTLCLPQKCAATDGKRFIANWYKKQANKILAERLDGTAQLLGLQYKAFCLTNARGKWGSCSGDNLIRLNWRLLFFDMDIIDYVIVHELCHTVYHNHAKAFWNLVANYCPSYTTYKKVLRERGVFMELFR